MEMYELSPRDGRKSFYGKAMVLIDAEGNETLYSYGTEVARFKRKENKVEVLGRFSLTTGRHITAFVNEHGIYADRFSSIPKELFVD
jgi:hypothetical protein